MTSVKSVFRPEVVKLKVKDLIPSKILHPRERNHPKFKQIATSMATIGLIEPIIVFPADRGFRVLDGHKRLEILRDLKSEEAECLIATADDAYTYNRRVNYLSTIGEHQMILRALRHNSEDTIAKVLNVDVSTIRKKRTLLNRICKEAVDVLKDRQVPTKAFSALKQMKPVRQVAAAQLMVSSNMYTDKFAQALLAGTSEQMLVSPTKSLKGKSLSPDQRLRLIAETDSLLANVKSVETTYGEEALTLSVCCRYIERLLNNRTMADYLARHHREVSDELQSLVASFERESATPMVSPDSNPQMAGR
jgi:RepB plasmid partitioning protein/ParB-like nuclease family protein